MTHIFSGYEFTKQKFNLFMYKCRSLPSLITACVPSPPKSLPSTMVYFSENSASINFLSNGNFPFIY